MQLAKIKSLKGKKLEKYLDTLVDHFIKITEHPKKGDLIFYPNSQEDGEPEKHPENRQRMAAFTGATLV